MDFVSKRASDRQTCVKLLSFKQIIELAGGTIHSKNKCVDLITSKGRRMHPNSPEG